MIQFQMFDHQPERCEKYHQMLKDNLPVLEGIGSEADFEKCGDSLGWFDIDTWANEAELSAIEELAARVRRDADVFVLIGVGGSNNAARSVIEAFPECDGPEIVYAGNSLSPWAFEQVMNKIRGKSVYIDCIAKNFQTLEPGSAFRVLREYLYETYGDKANERIIATGSRNSLLETICKEHGYSFVEFPQTVGGRYTAVTAVGLLPMAVAGIDIRALVKGAADMAAELKAAETSHSLLIAMRWQEISIITKDTEWKCWHPLNHSFTGSINGGSSYLRRVKAKKIRDFIRSVVNTQRNCTLSDSFFRMAAL